VSGITGSDLKKRIVRIMTEGLAAQLSLRKKLLLIAAAIAALAVPLAVGFTNAQQTGNSLGSFEVASIKPTNPGATYMSVGFEPGGRFVAESIDVETLIRNAYDVHTFQISGGPGWITSAKYDIVAKPSDVEPENPNETQRAESRKRHQQELQGLLANRFHFKFHEITKEQPIYALVISKEGPKLQAAAAPRGTSIAMRPGQLTSYGISLPSLAANLSGLVNRIVHDKTGLSGLYAFTLQWAAEENAATPLGRTSDMGLDARDASNAPSIFTAIQEQLGLKLEPARGPVSFLVIDHVERPTEN
jgi:uncharacterized protein (TIGR03435 family)